MAQTKKNEKLKSIQETGLSRGFSLAKLSLSLGAKAAGSFAQNILSDDSVKEKAKNFLRQTQAEIFAREIGKLKGSLMKAGQMLSMYGEQFFPPEVVKILKTLQNETPSVEWAVIEKQLKKNLDEKRVAELKVDQEALACASLGQVHVATVKKTGEKIALKIQYPGVDRAIDSDLQALRSLFNFTKIVPLAGRNFDEVFKEVRQMLHQEVDYEKELASTEEYRKFLGVDPRFVIPKTYPEYSSKRVLSTSFEEGVSVDSEEVLSLSQERRNQIAISFLDLYFKEVFLWHFVQTDPHFGNYRIRLKEHSGLPHDQVVLIDFGAVRRFPKSFWENHFKMIKGSYFEDKALLKEAAIGVGFMDENDPEDKVDFFFDFCVLIMEPFLNKKVYDWGNNDLAKRVTEKGKNMIFKYRFKEPPREVVFLDRKMGGIFVILSKLKAKIQTGDLLESYLKNI